MNNRSHFFRYLDPIGAIETLRLQELRMTAPGHLNDPEDLYFRKLVPFTADELTRAWSEMSSQYLRKGVLPPLYRKLGKVPEGAGLARPISDAEIEAIQREIVGNTQFLESYRKTFDDLTEKTNRELNDYLSDHFIGCFTVDASNEKMWKTYAQDGKGAVFKFECISEIDNVVRAAQPVRYERTAPTIGTKEEWIESLESGTGIDARQLYKKIVTWKHPVWSHEREWRVVYIEPRDKGKRHSSIALNPREISEIYLGPAMLNEHRTAIRDLLAARYPFTQLVQLSQC